jgi:hypothetical protein
MKIVIDKATAVDPFAASGSERAREREVPDELWALAVANTLVERLPRLGLPEVYLDSQGTPALPADGDDGGAAADLSGDGALDAAEGSGDARSSSPRGVPADLRVEVSDDRIGRLMLHIARAENGLDIVINVADSRVKALIEADQSILMKTLKDGGLCVASIQIGSAYRAGTALAGDRGSTERARSLVSHPQRGTRQRTICGSLEETEADSEGLDFTA